MKKQQNRWFFDTEVVCVLIAHGRYDFYVGERTKCCGGEKKQSWVLLLTRSPLYYNNNYIITTRASKVRL